MIECILFWILTGLVERKILDNLSIGDNFVRGLSPGVILDEDVGGDRGRVYDSDGNDVEEPTDSTGWQSLAARGYEEITASTVAIRIVDSAFDLLRSGQIRSWRFIRISGDEI